MYIQRERERERERERDTGAPGGVGGVNPDIERSR